MNNPVAGAGTLYYLAERAEWRAPFGTFLNAMDAAHIALLHPAQALIERAEALNEAAEEEPETARISQSEFLKPGSALTQIVTEITASSPTSPQPFLALAASFAALGALMGRRYRTETGLRLNLYIVGMADSGSGKNHARAWLRHAFMGAPELKPYLGADDLASTSGLMTSLHGQAAQLFQIDELGQSMKGMLGPRANPHKKALWAKLTEIYSQANGWVMGAAYAKERPRTDTNQPCCCIYGTIVSKPFWDAMKSGEGEDGSLARWLVFIPEIMHPDNLPAPQPSAISDDLRTTLVEITRGAEDHTYGGNLSELSPMRGDIEITPYTVPMEQTARSSVQALNEEQNAWLRSLEDNTKKAIVARYAENVQKIALICAVSDNAKRPIIQVKGIEYAKKLVKYCIETSMRGAEEYISENEYEANRNKISNFIKKAKSKDVTLSRLLEKSLALVVCV